MLAYAERGELVVKRLKERNHQGVAITARDKGSGILDMRKAPLDGDNTSGSLGMGLPGIGRLMDEFTVESSLQKGIAVIAKKWLHDHKAEFAAAPRKSPFRSGYKKRLVSPTTPSFALPKQA